MSAPTDAAGWFARRRIAGLTPAEQEAFEGWLAADPGNLAVYEAVEQAWAGTDALARDPRVAAMRQAAMKRGRPWRRWLAPAAAAAVLVAGPAAWFAWDSGLIASHQFQTRAWRTGVGERTTVTLPDGSEVTLNTDTVLRTEAVKGRRQLYLDKGQAYFKVAHDSARPFMVTAGGRTVTAVGTAFDVRVGQDLFEVTLVEGKIRVEAPVPERTAPSAPAAKGPPRVQSTEMVAGTQLLAADETGWKLQEVDARREIAWTTGQLVFVRRPLGEVVDELNRYSKVPIVIDDGRLAEIPITGTFTPGDNAGFAAALVSYRLARIVEQSSDGIRLAVSQDGVKKSLPTT